jgi:hypothetical protein
MLERSFFQFQNRAAIPQLYESEYYVDCEWQLQIILSLIYIWKIIIFHMSMIENNTWIMCHVWVRMIWFVSHMCMNENNVDCDLFILAEVTDYVMYIVSSASCSIFYLRPLLFFLMLDRSEG